MGVAFPLMAIRRVPPFAMGGGSRELNRLSRLMRDGVIRPDEYSLLTDAISHSTDETAPLQHMPRLIWRELVARFRLFGIASTQGRARLIANLVSLRIRAIRVFARNPFRISPARVANRISAILPHSSECRSPLITAGDVGAHGPTVPDAKAFRAQILPVRKGDIGPADTAQEYEPLKWDLDLSPPHPPVDTSFSRAWGNQRRSICRISARVGG